MIATLTPHTDFNPVPRVEIRIVDSSSFDGSPGSDHLDGGGAGGGAPVVEGGTAATQLVEIPDGTDTVTLWWLSEGQRKRVSGAIMRASSGVFAHLDLEAGFDVATSYELQCFAGSTSLGIVPLGAVVLPWTGDRNGCLIQQPLTPRLNAVVMNMEGSWPTVARSADVDMQLPIGSADPTVIGFGPMGAVQGVAVEFGAPTLDVAAAVKGTFGTAQQPELPVWLIRTHQGILPRLFFALVKSFAQSDGNMRAGGEWTTFSATLDECARPAPGLVTAVLRYSDLAAVFPTYSGMRAALPKYSDMASAWEYAGAAG